MDPRRVFVEKDPQKKPEELYLPEGLRNLGGFRLLSVALQEKNSEESEEEEGQCREWKGRGETDPNSNRWEAHGRHSETQTKPKEHEIPLTRAVPSLPRQIYPGSNSPSSRRPPSPALFPQLINLGFSEGQTLCPSP